ncbi:MAG: hypothetical protein HZC36_07955 [Armatimonadetes bacterium]|nr:hypothetical protein [Armatimonadota bacterium]
MGTLAGVAIWNYWRDFAGIILLCAAIPVAVFATIERIDARKARKKRNA